MENIIIAVGIVLLSIMYTFVKTQPNKLYIYASIIFLGMLPLIIGEKYLAMFIIFVIFLLQELFLMNERKNIRTKVESRYKVVNAITLLAVVLIAILKIPLSKTNVIVHHVVTDTEVFLVFMIISLMALQFSRKKLWK